MNIDERLEALTHSVELLAAMQRDNEVRWEQRWQRISSALEQDAENIRSLARIAEIHERRLSHLEGE